MADRDTNKEIVTAIRELLAAVEAAFERGISPEAINTALGPINLDHEDGVAHTKEMAERVRGLL